MIVDPWTWKMWKARGRARPAASYPASFVPELGQHCYVSGTADADGLPLYKIGTGVTQWSALPFRPAVLARSNTVTTITSASETNIFGPVAIPANVLATNGSFVSGWVETTMRNAPTALNLWFQLKLGANTLYSMTLNAPSDSSPNGRGFHWTVAATRESATALRGTVLGALSASTNALGGDYIGSTSGGALFPGSTASTATAVASSFWESSQNFLFSIDLSAAGGADNFLRVLQSRVTLNVGASC